jgi:hypothetical protein
MLNEGAAAQNRMAAGTASLGASANFNKNFIVCLAWLSLFCEGKEKEGLTCCHSAARET